MHLCKFLEKSSAISEPKRPTAMTKPVSATTKLPTSKPRWRGNLHALPVWKDGISGSAVISKMHVPSSFTYPDA